MTPSADLLLPDVSVPCSTGVRLDLDWHRSRAELLMARLEAEGYDAILLTVPWNIVYFTGLWTISTERPLYALLTANDDAPFWFYPTLDRDLIDSWWSCGGAEYFDLDHVAEGFPNRGSIAHGEKVDLWEWAWSIVKKRTSAKNIRRVCVDRELTCRMQRTARSILGYELQSLSGECLNLRMRKTDEELALTRRAYSYYDDVHAFGRDLAISEGEHLTDFELRTAMMDYATRRIVPDLNLDGRPHNGVGVTIDLHWVRAGRVTGYAHPNQFRFAPIERGSVLQVSGDIRVGGYGGECYRPYMISPRTPHMEKMWTVVRDSCLLQQQEIVAGKACSEVAYAIHEHQIEQGMQNYIYHRPAHGLGPEGHQPPTLSLGDHTILEPGMCFSVEPGLYDPANGIGVNFSDMFVVQETGPALQMSRVPWTEEWCWISI